MFLIFLCFFAISEEENSQNILKTSNEEIPTPISENIESEEKPISDPVDPEETTKNDQSSRFHSLEKTVDKANKLADGVRDNLAEMSNEADISIDITLKEVFVKLYGSISLLFSRVNYALSKAFGPFVRPIFSFFAGIFNALGTFLCIVTKSIFDGLRRWHNFLVQLIKSPLSVLSKFHFKLPKFKPISLKNFKIPRFSKKNKNDEIATNDLVNGNEEPVTEQPIEGENQTHNDIYEQPPATSTETETAQAIHTESNNEELEPVQQDEEPNIKIPDIDKNHPDYVEN